MHGYGVSTVRRNRRIAWLTSSVSRASYAPRIFPSLPATVRVHDRPDDCRIAGRVHYDRALLFPAEGTVAVREVRAVFIVDRCGFILTTRDPPCSMDRIIDAITLYTIENGMLTW